MFNRYWRSYPWFFQLLQFIILIMVLAAFFLLAVAPFLLHVLHVSADQILGISEQSPRNVINAVLIVQFFTATGIFLLPALLFAYFTHPKPAKYLGLVKPGKAIHWILAPVVIVSATPLFLLLAEWISHIDFGTSVKQAQEANDKAFKALLTMHTPLQFVATFFVLAILPGISEELFFRGLLMRFAAKRSTTVVFPLVVSAVLFTMMHSNIYGMLSIFSAGLLLGGIYYLTGSLWCSMVAHACYNGSQVILTYFAGNSPELKAIEENNSVPMSWVTIGTVVCAISFYFLWQSRTPLAKNWSADYTSEELAEELQ